MLMQKGTTNGFRFSDGMVYRSDCKAADMAVVPLSFGDSYAVVGRGTAKNVAIYRQAFGFWRIKRNG